MLQFPRAQALDIFFSHLLLHSYRQSIISPIFKNKTKETLFGLTIPFSYHPSSFPPFRVKLSNCSSTWLQFLSYFLLDPFQSGFHFYHSMKLFLTVTNDLHIFKSNVQFLGLILLDLAAALNSWSLPAPKDFLQWLPRCHNFGFPLPHWPHLLSLLCCFLFISPI